MNHRQIQVIAWTFCALLPCVAKAASTGSTGSDAAHQNMQPSLVSNYIIALQGVFPSQGGGSGGGDTPFVGEITLFTGDFAPSGWAFAQGQTLFVNQNTALHSILGYTYGGNGSTTFALPDLRGRVPIGTGQGPGLTNRTRGTQVGVESVALTESQMPTHLHTLPTTGSTGAAGGGATHTEMQPSLGLTYMIATQGDLPATAGGGSGGSATPMIGEVALFGGDFAPTGWAIADGSTLSPTGNPNLFSILGTTYGGNGTTTFALPDLRGRTAMGFGQGPSLSERELGEKLGAESVVLSTNELPSHTHSIPASNTGSTGGGAAHSNMQPALGLNPIVSLYGIVPGAGSGGDTPFIGEIKLFAGSFAPNGWAFANGSLLAIEDYPWLFDVMGNTYGGDGESTFALPDLRGRAAMGFGQGTGLTIRLLGQKVGVEDVALSVAEMPSHLHSYSTLPGDFNQDTTVNAADYVVWRNSNGTQPMYTSWRANFGQPGSGSGGAAGLFENAVPEPASTALLLMATASLIAASRKRPMASV